ncbi:MAG: multicopper oxidase, type 2 [Chthonomonadaceae bacterium]|nr:multicopper oxidase, type 2 [Chthonomonadaceae bacterium]
MTSSYRSALRRLFRLIPVAFLLVVTGRQLLAQTRPLYATNANSSSTVNKYYNSKVTPIISISGPAAPVCDAQGNLYVINSTNDGTGLGSTGSSITRITPNGSMRVFTASVPGASWLAFDPSGNLWACSAVFGQTNQPLYKVTPNGAVTTFATIPKNGQAVACDTAGNVYVKSYGIIYKVLPSGIVQTFATYPDSASGGGMVLDSGGNVYVPGFVSGSNVAYPLYKITPGGILSTFVTLPSHCYGLTIDSAANLYALEYDQNPSTIVKITSAGIQSTFATVPGPFQGGSSSLSTGIAYDGQGHIFVGNSMLSSIQKIHSDSSFTTLATGLGSTAGLASDGYKTLYVVDNTHKNISTIISDGTVTLVASLPTASSLQGLARDAMGNLYVADSTNNVVYEVSASGVVSTFLSGLAAPQSVAFDSKGNLYIVNGSQILRTAPDGSNEILFAQNLTNAYGIAIDSADNVFVSTTNGPLYKITPAQVVSTYKNLSGYGVAIDDNGDIYLATTFNISRIAPSGAVTTISNSSNNSYLALGQSYAKLFWHNTTGDTTFWQLKGTAVAASGYIKTLADLNWKIVATADLFHNGHSELIWQNSAGGDIVYWELSGSTIVGSGYIGSTSDKNWTIVATADLFHTGHTDLIWQHSLTGDVVYWDLHGATLVGSGYINTISDKNWTIVAVADLFHMGHTDLIWQNRASGDVVYWDLNGVSLAGSGYVNTISDLHWKIVGVGDLFQAGNNDLIWENSATGDIVYWEMNGSVITSSGYINTVADLNWKIQSIF